MENPDIKIDSTKSGLYYITEKEGTGSTPQKDEFILFDYTAYDLDGDAYETTIEEDAKLHNLYSKSIYYNQKYIQHKGENTSIPKGLEEGLSLIKKGAKVKFIMPSSLAYGANSYLSLMAYTSVIFEVDFTDIVIDPTIHELETIEDYIAENYPNFTPADISAKIKENGVYILEESKMEIDDPENTDDDPYQVITDDDVLKVNYAGRFTDNWLFDTNIEAVDKDNDSFNSSKEYKPIEVTIGGSDFIEGFSIAIKQLKTNTKAKVIILSDYAYGKIGDGKNIRPYSPLIFDLEVLNKN